MAFQDVKPKYFAVPFDLTDLIEQYGPNIKKLYGEEFNKLRFSKEDPSIYTLSAYQLGGTYYKSSGVVQIQWDVLKEKNYAIPNTLREYETIIKNYKTAHPTTEDGLETIGLTLSATDWHWCITLGNPAGFIATGRVLSLFDCDWDYADAEKVLKADGKYSKTYAGLPLTWDESIKCPSLAYPGLVVGEGIGISTTCKDPVAAIKFLDYICSDEGQVLINWGIEGVNYFIDEEGHRYRTAEEAEKSKTDKDYQKKTGFGFHVYPFPVYGAGTVDSTGSTYTVENKETIMAEYNEEEKEACRAWGVDLLVDIFPQTDEFEVPKYSPIWAYAKPAEFNEIDKKLDEISWPGLIKCVIGKEADFDENYAKMLNELEKTGMYDAEKMLSDIVKEKVDLSEE